MQTSGEESYVSDRQVPTRDLNRRLWYRRKKQERRENRRQGQGKGGGKGPSKGKPPRK
jgi:hypothetical protein